MKPGGKSFLVYSTAVSADAAKLSRNISKKKGLNITDWSKQAIVDVVSFYNYETGKWEMLFEFVSSVQSKALPFLWRKLKIANQPAQKWKKAKKKKTVTVSKLSCCSCVTNQSPNQNSIPLSIVIVIGDALMNWILRLAT